MEINKRTPHNASWPTTEAGLVTARALSAVAAAAGLVAGAALPAWVQAQPSQESTQPTTRATLPPITVRAETGKEVAKQSRTGTKTDTPLIETPQSISVVGREQIEDQGATNVGQALRYTPGVVAEWRGMSSAKYDHILVRGSAGYTVDAYWDGLKVPSLGSIGGPTPDPYFLERIEVLRGPASVLYGQGAANGLVHLVSKKPTSETVREVRLSVGDFGYRQLGFDFGGPMDDEKKFLYRLTGVGLDSGSPVDFVKEKRIGIAPSFTWRPNADTSLTVLASYQHDPELGYYDTRPAIGTAFANPYGKVPMRFYAGEPGVDRTDRKYAAIGYAFEHRFDEHWAFRQNLRHVEADYDWKATAFQSLRSDLRTANRYTSNLIRYGSGLELDNQMQGSFTTGALTHTLLVGLDHLRENANSIGYAGTAAPIDIYFPVYGGATNFGARPRADANQRLKQTGFYLQDQIKWDRLSVLLGARRDRATSTSSNKLTAKQTDAADSATTWRAGSVYQFDNGVAPYASYAESFQPVGGFDASGNPFKPARGRQYEVGVKWQPNASQALLTLAAFDLNEDNLSTPDDRNIGFNVQLGQVRTRGIEFEGRLALAQGLSLTAAYTYLDSEVTRGAARELGKSRPNSPRHAASLLADYAFSGELAGLGLGLGVRYVGASPANTANAPNYFEAPGYTLVDLALRYDLGRMNSALRGMRLDVNIKNLLDRKYVGSCGGSSPAVGYCWAGYPRTAVATLSYRW